MFHPWQVFSNHRFVVLTLLSVEFWEWTGQPLLTFSLLSLELSPGLGLGPCLCLEEFLGGWEAIPIPKASQKVTWSFHLLTNGLCLLEVPVATHRGRGPRPPLNHP